MASRNRVKHETEIGTPTANSVDRDALHRAFVSIPPAAIQLSDTNVVLSWPGAATGFVLPQNSDLTLTNRGSVTNQTIFTNGLDQGTVPLNGSSLSSDLSCPC